MNSIFPLVEEIKIFTSSYTTINVFFEVMLRRLYATSPLLNFRPILTFRPTAVLNLSLIRQLFIFVL